MLKHRLILGSIFIAAIVAALWADQRLDATPWPDLLQPLGAGRDTLPPGIIVFIALLAVSFLAARELARIMRDNSMEVSARVTCSAAMAGLAASAFVPDSIGGVHGAAAVSSTAVAVLVLALVFYSRHKSFEGVVALAGAALLSFVYLGLMFGFILAIRRDHSAWTLLWVLTLPKAYDTGAYFTGRAVGRHKLIPWLSPGKTWEGLAGGVIAAAVFGAAGAAILGLPRSGWPPALWGGLAGATMGLVGQAGDLIASLFKRDAGLKDSSRLVPGFGGVLDLVDSPLLVAPLAYWWLALAPDAPAPPIHA